MRRSRKLIGTTKPTIGAVRDRTHWNSANIKPRHPVGLGLRTMEELDQAIARATAARPARWKRKPAANRTRRSRRSGISGETEVVRPSRPRFARRLRMTFFLYCLHN